MAEIERVGETSVAPENSEGAHYLRLLGFEGLIGQNMPNRDLPWEGFLGLCGPDTKTFLAKLERTDPQSREYAVMMDYTRRFVKEHLTGIAQQPDQN